MAFENLSDREKLVLFNLISHYIESADPVGSRVIADRFRMGISSATIRNTLQDLEDLGLVEQPHTSAGRVPTDKGYRVYVDYLLKPDTLSETEKETIKQSILREGRGISEILGQTARVLSDITDQLGLTVAPRFEEGVLGSLRLIPVSEGRLMVVVIVKSGLARSLILEVEASVSDSALREVEQGLTERLTGLTLSEIRRTITERMAGVSGQGRLIKLVMDAKDRIWTEDRAGDLHYAGTNTLLSKPEFADRGRLSKLMKVLEDGKVLLEFLGEAEREGLIITIGEENKMDEIINCSLVKSTYRVGNITGTIGIIGPTRMPYAKAVSIVEYTARSITELLAGMKPAKEL
ncbi:MAG TPA: heat-inducible transcriptional repressor HrcA [Acidobacteriota bacterium]|nr:heat-inducible transcriptional repressor HrcA [Acidobacteriota bacterium]